MAKMYQIWNDFDPNDRFEVEAENHNDAAFAALEELGWVVGAHYEDETETDEEN
jgi:hypothetical protein